MPILEPLLLTLTLVLCGGYAGLVLMVQIGILPGLRLLSPGAFADVWRAMDRPMGRSMPPYKGALLLANLGAVVVLALDHRTPLAVATGASLLFSLAGLVVTVRGQFPLNAKLQALPASVPDETLIEIRDRTVRGIAARCILAGAAFVVLCVGAIVWPIR